MDTKRINKQPFDVSAAHNPFLLERFVKLMGAVSKYSVSGIFVNRIILVGTGTWLRQNSYTDESGFYVDFRCDPSTVYNNHGFTFPGLRAQLVKDFIADCTALFGAPKLVEDPCDDLTDAVTLWWHEGTYSIGD